MASNGSVVKAELTPDEIRRILLQYFYDRNNSATSAMGKKGSAIKISDIKAELKAQSLLSQQQVQSNLTYLISQGWIDEKEVRKEIRGAGGTTFPSVTTYYQISASGIDKIEGPGEFTMNKFHGIKIEATGQNIITVGDGNRIDAAYKGLGDALAELSSAIASSSITELEKLSLVADIDTIQAQLAKPVPNRKVISAAWEGVRAGASIGGFATLVQKVSELIGPLLF